jgi:transposase, IS5 family
MLARRSKHVSRHARPPELNAALTYSDGTQGGRPPILVIQTTNNLSDERPEFLIKDRLSFMRFSRIWIVGSRPRRPDDLAVPGETREGRRHRAIVRALRCDASAIRSHRRVGPDRRCARDYRSASAPRPGREEGDQGRAHPRRLEDKPAKLRQKDRDARWTVKYTKAKPREDGSTPPVDLPFHPCPSA